MRDDAGSTNSNAGGSFTDRQIEFAAYLRDPDNEAAPADVEIRRMRIYRDLFFNNISGFLAKCFPVARGCLSDDAWRALIRDFYRDHASRSPLFTKLSKEFLTYLSEEREPRSGDLPFLYELAHYEWVEVELAMSPDVPLDDSIDRDGDLLDARPVLSPLAWGLSYCYAVNEINQDHQPSEPAATPVLYLVYRNADDKVKYVKLNTVSARLFELLDTRPELTGHAALDLIAAEMQHPNPATVVEGGHAILRRWHELGVVMGTRSVN